MLEPNARCLVFLNAILAKMEDVAGLVWFGFLEFIVMFGNFMLLQLFFNATSNCHIHGPTRAPARRNCLVGGRDEQASGRRPGCEAHWRADVGASSRNLHAAKGRLDGSSFVDILLARMRMNLLAISLRVWLQVWRRDSKNSSAVASRQVFLEPHCIPSPKARAGSTVVPADVARALLIQGEIFSSASAGEFTGDRVFPWLPRLLQPLTRVDIAG